MDSVGRHSSMARGWRARAHSHAPAALPCAAALRAAAIMRAASPAARISMAARTLLALLPQKLGGVYTRANTMISHYYLIVVRISSVHRPANLISANLRDAQ